MSKDLALAQVEWDLHENPQSFVPLEFTEEINPETFGLEIVKAQEMTIGLYVTIAEREVLKNAYIDVIELPINSETLPIFKELRLKIVKNRTQGIEKWHKINKAFYLSGGRFVDAVKNREVLINEEMESKLMEGEKFFENQEKEKALLLNLERIEKMRPYVDCVIGLDFSEFSDYDFDDFVLGKKTRFEADAKEREAEALRIENERLAEIEKQRLAEIENQKIRVENSRLQKEAELKDIELQKERKLQADENAKIKAKNNALAKELQAKKDAELKEENDRLAKIEDDKKTAILVAKAPVKKQLSMWVESFELSKTSVDNETSKEIIEKFEAFKKWANNQINNL